jgi:hypothetical protein
VHFESNCFSVVKIKKLPSYSCFGSVSGIHYMLNTWIILYGELGTFYTFKLSRCYIVCVNFTLPELNFVSEILTSYCVYVFCVPKTILGIKLQNETVCSISTWSSVEKSVLYWNEDPSELDIE